jgi:hypothetical protein
MKRSWACLAVFLGIAVLLTGCDLGEPSTSVDPQRVKVFFKYDFRDQVDTFNGTLTKDLVMNGTVTVPFGFKQSEQDSLLSVLARAGFFALPDTLYPMPNVSIWPDPGFQVLRVEFEGTTKCLVWMELLNESDPRTGRVRELWARLRNLVQSTDTYKQLPPAAGGYL